MKGSFFSFLTMILILSIFFGGGIFYFFPVQAEEEIMTEEEKADLIQKKKQELELAEKKAEDYQEKTQELNSQAETLATLIEEINQEIFLTEEAIAKVQVEIDKVEMEISQKVVEIEKQEKELRIKKDILAEYLRLINRLSRQSFLEVMLTTEDLGEYLQELASLGQASDDIKKIHQEIKAYKKELIAQKQILVEQEESYTALKIMQLQQKSFLEKSKQYKDNLLVETKGEEAKYQTMLEKEEGTATRIRGELTALQSLGESIDFKEALAAARYASGKTGARVVYLLGVLRVESNMGNNVGGGHYQVDMHPAQREKFEKICEDLDYDPDEMPVSKKHCYRDEEGNCTGWGGAMGPAQFMPSTWMGYKKKVEETMHVKAADPWNLRHALVAMGLKLAKVPGVSEGKESAEKKAANIYLAGSNWENFTWYGDRVMLFAEGFEDKIKKEGL